MTVGRSHAFTLDDATLSGGAVIAAAGSGLPRRITGGIDFGALVLSLNPSGFWRMREAPGLARVDSSANARNLAYVTGTATALATSHTRGGQSATALRLDASSNAAMFVAGGSYPEHNFTAGTPATWVFALKSVPAGSSFASGSVFGTVVAYTTGPGWNLSITSAGGIALSWNSGTAYATLSSFAYYPGKVADLLCGEWGVGVLRYNGGSLLSTASWSLTVGGVACSTMIQGSAAAVGTGAALFAGTRPNATQFGWGVADLAFWHNTRLTDAQAAQVSSATPSGRATWTLPAAAYSRTLKGWQLPGRLARADLTRLGVRCYYSINGAAEVEFDPGDDLSVTIPASGSCTIAADLTHYHLDDLPWIADASGGGPVALYDEADPVVPPVQIPSGRVSASIRKLAR